MKFKIDQSNPAHVPLVEAGGNNLLDILDVKSINVDFAANAVPVVHIEAWAWYGIELDIAQLDRLHIKWTKVEG